jgi:hypothetical protein
MMEVDTDASPRHAISLRATGSVIFVGHARLPQSLAPRDSSPVVCVEVETDTSSGEILGVGSKAIPDLGQKLISSVLIGHNINENPSAFVDEIRRRYICPSQKAVSTAVLNAFEAYQRYRQVGLE